MKNKYDLKKLIKSKFKNKVVYIDFWASWCAPCMAEMPSSFELHEKYKKKDVVFLYISIDTDFEKWKMAINKVKLSTLENSFIAVNYPSASFYRELQLKTIPRYLIYDKTGKLVHRNAPSPDSKEIRNEIDKYLSQ
jgi:thiol-disulfide isomerase/thioredoxin